MQQYYLQARDTENRGEECHGLPTRHIILIPTLLFGYSHLAAGIRQNYKGPSSKIVMTQVTRLIQNSKDGFSHNR